VTRRLLLIALLALSLSAIAATSAAAAAKLPTNGVFRIGNSLAGIHLGDTPAMVKARWGTDYKLCRSCAARTWLYLIRGAESPVGAAVSFRSGRVAALFTLGTPLGWHSAEGLKLGGSVEDIPSVYTADLDWNVCIGYGALSVRKDNVVSSIYTQGTVIYGFALTRPSEPICQ
jgi:hypothetical protein